MRPSRTNCHTFLSRHTFFVCLGIWHVLWLVMRPSCVNCALSLVSAYVLCVSRHLARIVTRHASPVSYSCTASSLAVKLCIMPLVWVRFSSWVIVVKSKKAQEEDRVCALWCSRPDIGIRTICYSYEYQIPNITFSSIRTIRMSYMYFGKAPPKFATIVILLDFPM